MKSFASDSPTPPIFTIVTPSFNSSKYIEGCIISVNAQNVHLEHLIKDSLSTDSTLEVIERLRLAGKAPNTKAISEIDFGLSDGLNQALQHANGKYIGWLNTDDFYMPGILNEVQKIFDSSNVDVVYGDCVFVDETGKFLRLTPAHFFSSTVLREYGCFISSCSTFIRKSAMDNFTFDIDLKRAMDWDCWLELSKTAKFRYVPKIFAAFRIHGDQITATPISMAKNEFAYFSQKHNLRTDPTEAKRFNYASLLHVLLKIISGSYFRQIKSRIVLSKKSMTWWDSETFQTLFPSGRKRIKFRKGD